MEPETRTLPLQAAVEMLKRELEASKSVTTHAQFLKRIAAGEATSPGLRDQLLDHIDEEEREHQDHLARLLPTLETLARELGGGAPPAPSAPGLTVGSLIASRPWWTRPLSS